jgi:thiamine-monophosphate kinase
MTDANQIRGSIQGEEAIIALLAPLAEGHPGALGLKDDCALLAPPPGAELVLKTDPIAEGVHFLASDTPEDIAWKALAVNVSDIVAKGARPLGYLMALSFPQPPTDAWMSRFVDGLRAAQRSFGCHLMGGDTDRRSGPLTMSVTMIGAVPAGRMVRRATAKPGDRLFVSGTIGDAALGLLLARDPAQAASWKLSTAETEHLLTRYRRPTPRLALAPILLDHAGAAMDLSDGLLKDLDRMLRASGAAGRLDAGRVPLSEPARRIAATSPDWLGRLITAGDDYEVLCAIPPSKTASFAAAGTASGIPVTEIGTVQEGPSALAVTGPDGRPLALPERKGWDHF